MNKEAMSKQDSGRKGGQARASAYSVVQLSAQAKQSAITVEKRYPGFHCKIGVKGGGARASKYNHEELSDQSQRGAATIEKKDPGFHARIGSKGGILKSRKIKI